MLYCWMVKYLDQGHMRHKKIVSTVYDLGNKCMNECIYDHMIVSISKTDERYV